MLQKTLVMIKPDATKRDIHNEILNVIGSCGLKAVASVYGVLPMTILQQLYAEHADADFYQSLLVYISSGPCLVAVMEGRHAVAKCIEICGTNTHPDNCENDTIRGIWGISLNLNSVHRSASEAEALREIALFFPSLN